MAIHQFLVGASGKGNTLREIPILVVSKGLPLLSGWRGVIGVEFRRDLCGQSTNP